MLTNHQMPASKAKALSSLFRSAIQTASNPNSSASTAADATLKHFVSSLDTSSSPTTSTSETPHKRSHKTRSKTSVSKAFSDLAIESLKIEPPLHLGRKTKYLSKEISSILCDATSSDKDGSSAPMEDNDDEYIDSFLEMPWFSTFSHSNISLRRKEVSRDRKQKWIFKSTQTHRFDTLVKMCGKKLGTDATIQMFGKLGRETGVKEYNALIGLCIEKAREAQSEIVWLEEISKAYRLLMLMRDQGFELEEECYGPFLMFLVDMEMVEEFQYFCGTIRGDDLNSLPRFAYYEMLLWIRVNNEVKIEELCDNIATNDEGDKPNYKEHYLMALCESDRKKELLPILEAVDITKFSSLDILTNIFRSLGRLLLESFVEKCVRALKGCDIGAENISNFIYHYASSVPNLAVRNFP